MKQVLITGGATGIGAATAQVFLERGYRVFVTVHQTAAELPGFAKFRIPRRRIMTP